MNTLTELQSIVNRLERLTTQSKEPNIHGPLLDLTQAANTVGKAWSGSWIGYHANVYYKDLQSPPPGAHFSPEWGSETPVFGQHTTGDWVTQDPEQVQTAIYRLAGNPRIILAHEFNALARTEFNRNKNDLLSILDVEMSHSNSQFLIDQREGVTGLSLLSESGYIERIRPEKFMSRDSLALSQGAWVPPHIRVLAQVVSIQTTIQRIESLAEIARLIGSHVRRSSHRRNRDSSQGNRVFIGHGRSHIWRELKDFLEDQLGLRVDEFNRVQIAGIATVHRLQTMLDSAAIAFLVMTGEDELPSGRFRARENVVHEVGLFQGRLGFDRAIILLEEGCDEFSNIAGLGQTRFPKNNIRAAFQDVREVLEREGIVSTRVAS